MTNRVATDGGAVPPFPPDVHPWLVGRRSAEDLQSGIDELRIELGPNVSFTQRFDADAGTAQVIGWSLDSEETAALALVHAHDANEAYTYSFAEDGPARVQSGGNTKSSSDAVVTDLKKLPDEKLNISGVVYTRYLVDALSELAAGAVIVIGPRDRKHIIELAPLLLFHDCKTVAMINEVTGDRKYITWQMWPRLLEEIQDPRFNPSGRIPGFIAANSQSEVLALHQYYLRAVR